MGQSFSFSESSFGAGTGFVEPGIVVGGSAMWIRCGSMLNCDSAKVHGPGYLGVAS